MRQRPVQGSHIRRVLEVDPDLAERVPPERRSAAVRALICRSQRLEPGRVPLGGGLRPAGGFGLLVVDGVIALRTPVRGRAALELVGAGDLVQPWLGDGDGGASPEWRVVAPAELLVLDERFARRAAPWPEVAVALVERIAARELRLSRRLAANGLPRIEERILDALAALAARWGKVTSRGVLIPLRLTHQQIAELVSAKRPSVSTAMKSLAEDGRISYTREWLLLRERPLNRAAAGDGRASRSSCSRTSRSGGSSP